jgi:uncharacterized protein YeaO (DUF488 family)
MDVRLKRAYEPASVEDGYRVFVGPASLSAPGRTE